MNAYYRPIVHFHTPRPDGALDLAGGPGWFSHAVRHERGQAERHVPVNDLPEIWRIRLSAPRPPVCGLDLSVPRLMGILNVTPDSFSDGGQNTGAVRALARARQMRADGAHLIDVGGESTRPGAPEVPIEAEIARIEPVINALRHEMPLPVSIDTRKAQVAQVALSAGAGLINDVSGFTFDPALAPLAAARGVPVCIMHMRGTPEIMQDNVHFDDVLLDVYDALDERISALEALGIARHKMIVDPGIGFGKHIGHNLTLLSKLSLFHGLGCALLIGASRKGFIGQITGAHPAAARVHGSVVAALAAAQQGAQILRVHDVAETAQALAMWRAIFMGEYHDA